MWEMARSSFSIICWLSLALAFIGCKTVPLPPTDFSEPGWKIQQGQAIWRAKNNAPEVAGELLLATNPDGRTVVQFTKTPVPFVIAQRTLKSWQLEIPAQNKKYSGSGKAPGRISWFHLPTALKGSVLPEPWVFRKPDNENWHLENKSTGEMIEGFLNP
jgi:hypothetical protein